MLFKNFYMNLFQLVLVRQYVFIIAISFFLLNSHKTYSQNFQIKNIQYRADDYFRASLFDLALRDYKKLDSLVPENAEIKYKIGICLLNSVEKTKALDWFLKAQNLNFTTDGFSFNLAKAYHVNSQFQKALEFLQLAKIKNQDSMTTGKFRKIQIDQLERHCFNALRLSKFKNNVKITNLGSTINSKYPEYSPVLFTDENKLIFTSCRPNNIGKTIDIRTNRYYEDLWQSVKNDSSQWQIATNMGFPINTEGHDASAAVSFDGRTLLVYRNENLYFSEYTNKLWALPALLPKTINSEAWESCASISSDGQQIYFSSNKKGGFGGKDIYVCNKQKDGTWGKPFNLGKEINSTFDEEAPFIHPNRRTLYFSSDRPESIGGYDIFFSSLDTNNKWTSAINIGVPINSPEDDIDFVWSADGRRAYFSSIRPEGFGAEDIYMLEWNVKEKPLLIISGNTIDKSNKPIKAILKFTELYDKEKVINTVSAQEDGAYKVALNPGKRYVVEVLSEKHLPYSEQIYVEDDSAFLKKTIQFMLQPLELGEKSILRNIYFDSGKAILKPESLIELQSWVVFLNASKLKIKIIGHTDNVGDKAYNLSLSKDRAASVANFFTKNGIASQRLQIEGLGDSSPVESNENELGRQFNRRIEIEVIQ
ncbi:MAG: hypothetical protein EAZ07_01295 [Cytophagales bacterium]|nr:MAG: hypothetical protein EAZ07_01295 [Cytophagales bacterium]